MGGAKVDKYDSDEPVKRTLRSRLTPHVVMILCQLLSGVYYVVTYSALVNGMNRVVLSLYRDVLAMCVLIPVAYFVDKGNRIKLSWDVILHLLVLGLTGIYGSNYLLFTGIQYTSAEVSAALQPAVPILTSLIAIVFGVETVMWRRRDGQAKFLGVVSGCTGAIVMTAYKGRAIIGLWNDFLGVQSPTDYSLSEMNSAESGTVTSSFWFISSWQFGILCLLGNCTCMATFINLQRPLLKRFPAPSSILCYSYGFGAILMGVTGYFSVTDPAAWALGWDENLLAVVYNGLIASALNFVLMCWVLHTNGPLFVATYIPLQPVITGILALIFLGTTIYLGSVIGIVLVITGLLLVSWAGEETVRLDAHLTSLPRHSDDFLRDPLIPAVTDEGEKSLPSDLLNESVLVS